MKFSINRLALLKALQSVRVDVAGQHSLVSFFEVSLQAMDVGTVVVAAGDIKRTIDAEVTQAGTVFFPIKRFSRILQNTASETAEFTMESSGQVEIVCDAQRYHLGGASGGASSDAAVLEDTTFRVKKQRRMTTVPMVLSIVLHAIFVSFVVFTIKDRVIQEDAITMEWVDPPEMEREIKKPIVKRVQPKAPRNNVTREVSHKAPVRITESTRLTDTRPQSLIPMEQDVDFAADIPDTAATPITTDTDLPTVPNGLATGTPDAALGDGRRRGGGLTDSFRATNRGTPQGGGIRSGIRKTGATDDLGEAEVDTDDFGLVPKNKLGAVLRGDGPDIWGHIRLIRLRHSLADWWQDPTAIPSFIQWLKENTQIHADLNFEGGALPLTDPRILDAPLIIMTGHDKNMVMSRNLIKGGGTLTEAFTQEERAALRKYIIERGGMLFFDDCGFKGLFAATVAYELQEIFSEYSLQNIPHTHDIYTIYYQLSGPPTGGDVFWESENNPKVSPFKFQKGISIGTRLAVVFNRKDYMCAMETAEIESRTRLRMRRSKDVHRFMTNLLVYAMRHGGNTDRSEYKQ